MTHPIPGRTSAQRPPDRGYWHRKFPPRPTGGPPSCLAPSSSPAIWWGLLLRSIPRALAETSRSAKMSASSDCAPSSMPNETLRPAAVAPIL